MLVGATPNPPESVETDWLRVLKNAMIDAPRVKGTHVYAVPLHFRFSCDIKENTALMLQLFGSAIIHSHIWKNHLCGICGAFSRLPLHFKSEKGDLASMKNTQSPLIRLNEKRHRNVRRLTRRCCNYDQGNCIVLDDGAGCPCVQGISLSLNCRWFRNAVLPLNPALELELCKHPGRKKCRICGKPHITGSNRAQFCPDCSRKRRREKEAARQRQRYWRQSTHLGA